jgi:hypothetical protein
MLAFRIPEHMWLALETISNWMITVRLLVLSDSYFILYSNVENSVARKPLTSSTITSQHPIDRF